MYMCTINMSEPTLSYDSGLYAHLGIDNWEKLELTSRDPWLRLMKASSWVKACNIHDEFQMGYMHGKVQAKGKHCSPRPYIITLRSNLFTTCGMHMCLSRQSNL